MHFKTRIIVRRITGPLSLALLAACGGGSSPQSAEPAQPNIAFRVQHFLYHSPDGSSSMNLLVRSVEPRFSLATKGVARVDFLLFGHEMQTLTQPSEAALPLPALRYYFDIPADFNPAYYTCGTGEYLSEVRVTDTAGQVLSQTFELCPGVPVDLPPVFSSP